MLIDHKLVEQAKASLGDKNADIMAEELNLQKYSPENKRALCCWHNETVPSLVYNAKNYTFHCFGCNRTVDILDVFMSKGMTYVEAVEKLFALADMPYAFGEKGIRTKRDYVYPAEEPKREMNNVIPYMASRCISEETLNYFDVREDAKGNCVFNYYDTNDVLTMVKYRPSHKLRHNESKMWCQKGSDTAPLLYNMNRCNPDMPLVITEGECDAMAVFESGYHNVVSVPLGAGNTKWIQYNWDWLEQFKCIIVCVDNDAPGVKLQKEMTHRLGSWRCKYVQFPSTVKTPDGRHTISIKDANEVLCGCGKSQLLDYILHAQDTPIPGVIDFSDIEDIDLDQLDGIYTGFADMDDKLMKLFFGNLVIVTGVNGSGKSSFLNQIICQSLNQGYDAFLYSGELPNQQAKNWLVYQLAGRYNLHARTRKNGKDFWVVNQEARDKINEYYKGRLYIYDDSEDKHVEVIFDRMESLARKYGTKTFVIDNLTAVNLGGSEDTKYEKQIEFISNLIKFAVTYNVLTILVVHPHKMDFPRRMNKMDVQGAMAMSDLAHRLIGLYRVTKYDRQQISPKSPDYELYKCDVIVDILKDRMRGYEGQSFGYYYDKPSRRFYSNRAELDFQYKWDKVEHSPLPMPSKDDNHLDDIVPEM